MNRWLALFLVGCAGEPARTTVADATPVDASKPDTTLLASTTALVTVRTADWNTSSGTLTRFRRGAAGWESLGAPSPVKIGRSGLAWGRGLHGQGRIEGFDGGEKKEGDGRSPAGAFRLRKTYGYAATPPAGSAIAYEPMTTTLQCIEDTTSAFYNQIVDREKVTPDWSSTDLLRRKDGLYELIAFVEHNTAPVQPGAGSCILLHVWTSDTTPTAGCTSMPLDALRTVIAGLAAEGSVLVQLPEDAYGKVRETWGLPD
jgi:zinc D-Ala-D-Ala dipeptidase